MTTGQHIERFYLLPFIKISNYKGIMHRCARGPYGLLMRRQKARIYTPPRREKNTPPTQINSHPLKEFWKNFRIFSINLCVSCISFSRFNWNKSIFKNLRLRRAVYDFLIVILISEGCLDPPQNFFFYLNFNIIYPKKIGPLIRGLEAQNHTPSPCEAKSHPPARD